MVRAVHKVLLVDDNPADIELVRLAFEETSMRVELQTATDGDAALACFRRIAAGDAEDGAELILLDINLPQLSGHQLLAALKGDPRLAKIPAVMLTTSDAPHDRARSLALGATRYLVKPSSFDELVSMLESLGPLLASPSV